MKILVVEDDFSCREILTLFLSKYGECDVATDGLKGVEAVKESLDNESPYDLICLDIHLPGMDGLDVLAEIRKIERDDERLGPEHCSKIVMISVLREANRISQALHDRADGYLVKPVSREKLEEQMEELGLLSKVKSV